MNMIIIMHNLAANYKNKKDNIFIAIIATCSPYTVIAQ